MVDFGNSIFEGKLNASVPLLNPVDDRSGETFAGALADGIDRFNKSVFNPTAKASQADAAKNGLFSEYIEKVNLIADAKDQGKMGTDEAMRNIRVADNQFLSNHPELTEDFFTLRNKVMTENGFGGSIIKETPAEAGNRKKLEGYAQEGWDINNPESLAAAERFSQDKIYLSQVANEISKIEASGQIASANIKAQAITGLHSVVANGIPWVNDQINSAYTQLQGVTDPAQRQAIIDQTKAKVAQQTAIIQQLRAQTGDTSSAYLLTGIEGLMASFDEVASGKTTLAATENANKMIAESYKNLMLTSDPELAALMVMDQTSPFKNPEAYMKLDQLRLDWASGLNSKVTLGENGEIVSSRKPPDLIDKAEKVALVFDNEKQTIANLVKDGYSNKEAVAAQANKIVNIMQSAERYGANDSDPRNFTGVVDFLADPTVGKFISDNGSLIYPQVAAGSKQVIEQQYNEVVVNLINDRWTTATEQVNTAATSGGFAEQLGLVGNQQPGSETTVDISKFIEPMWNGVGIEFKVNDAWRNNPQLKQIAKDLNQGPDSVAAPLNKLIRASAHMSGNTDYEKVYNEQYKTRLWKTGEDVSPTLEQMTGKDLSGPASLNELSNIPKGALEAPKRPDDYKETTTTLRGQTGQLLDAIGAAEGSTYNTMFGYAERPGGAFEGTNITSMTLNEIQALQKEMVKKNGISSAIGKYQFIQDTLKEAIKGLGLKGDEKFTPEIQDKLAIWLLKNRTSFDKWASGEADPAAFQNELASQWASIPNTSGKSAYAGDGVNNASAEGKRLIGLL